MVLYINDVWVLESNTEDFKIESKKNFVVYNPKTEKVLFSDDNIYECIKYAESFKPISKESILKINNLLSDIKNIKNKLYSVYGFDSDDNILDFLNDINKLSIEYNDKPTNEIFYIIKNYNLNIWGF